jgi:exodeoxyribonuclease V alpha subunit
MLLQRNLIYTGITRGKRLLVLIGQKKALGIAVHNDRPQRRYSGLLASLMVPSIDQMCPLTRK